MTPRAPAAERGSGLLSAAIGIAVVLGALGLTVNVALGLWTRSTVDAIAYDAARSVATHPAAADPAIAPPDLLTAESAAIAHARTAIGPFGDRVSFSFEHPDADVVVLHVEAPGVSLLPRFVDGGPVVGAIDRRVVLRREGR